MPTDYILFVHGVKTHNKEEFSLLTKRLLNRIKANINDESRKLKPICFFWGDLNLEPQKELLAGFDKSPKWKDFWFKNFRTEQILEFVGDAALYLSRHIGAQVVQRFKDEALGQIKNIVEGVEGDRLHLVTHSWGTIILFDILFAARWEDPRLNADIRQTVDDIRKVLYGLSPSPQSGVPLTSIHTMGSPLSLFSLINISDKVDGVSTHDLTPQLKSFLKCLYNLRGQRPLVWRNFAHPGDPIAFPLEGVKPLLLDGSADYVEIVDVITDRGNIFNLPFNQTLFPLVWGGESHGSYWDNELVAKAIGEVIQSVV